MVCTFPALDNEYANLPGLAVNIGISLRCHVDDESGSYIDRELKRRCFAGLLMLHTIQAVSLDIVDIQCLTAYEVPLPSDVNDVDVQIHSISAPSSSPTQNSYMLYKYKLYNFAARISKMMSQDVASLDYDHVLGIDHEIGLEQRTWDARWLSDARYESTSHLRAQLFILNMYANQLYLVLHKPFFQVADSTNSVFKQAAETQVRILTGQ